MCIGMGLSGGFPPGYGPCHDSGRVRIADGTGMPRDDVNEGLGAS